MLSPHLIRQIEQRADRLAVELVDEVLHNPHTPSFRRLPREELLEQALAIYRRLGDWLAGRSETEIETTYGPRGRDRFLEGVPVDEMVYSLLVVKRMLRAHTKQVSSLTSAAEIHSEMEVDAMIGTFFDRVVYAMVHGHEHARREAEHPHRNSTSTLLGDMKPGNLGWIP